MNARMARSRSTTSWAVRKPLAARLAAERFNPGKDDADMAALVRSPAEPGLKDRIAAYAAAVAAARKGG